ncbi:MAG: helix-turn-helix transcriptional regulator [Myxococcota bacterium]|nr:helix-turn-helix transcriptional regulator [Myxococcota bacterium]
MPTRLSRRALRRLSLRLAGRLRRLRAARGWTQRAAAGRIGVGPVVLRRLESGRANPSLAVLLSVARVYRVDLAELLGPATDAGRDSAREKPADH